jgi:potassium channel subfamily K, other eukaryote
MAIHDPPHGPGETYSQGYWHAVMASILYLVGSAMLVGNMIGYFKGHYPQHFELDDDQRTLILQTMMYFLWLAGGAGVFCRLEGWTYPDALYYVDVVSFIFFLSWCAESHELQSLTNSVVDSYHRFWRRIPNY